MAFNATTLPATWPIPRYPATFYYHLRFRRAGGDFIIGVPTCRGATPSLPAGPVDSWFLLPPPQTTAFLPPTTHWIVSFVIHPAATLSSFLLPLLRPPPQLPTTNTHNITYTILDILLDCFPEGSTPVAVRFPLSSLCTLLELVATWQLPEPPVVPCDACKFWTAFVLCTHIWVVFYTFSTTLQIPTLPFPSFCFRA